MGTTTADVDSKSCLYSQEKDFDRPTGLDLGAVVVSTGRDDNNICMRCTRACLETQPGKDCSLRATDSEMTSVEGHLHRIQDFALKRTEIYDSGDVVDVRTAALQALLYGL